MVQSSGRFKAAHTGCYLSAQAYGEACDELPSASSGPELVEGSRVVRRFETALYKALLRGQSKKRYLHALFSSEFLRRACVGAGARLDHRERAGLKHLPSSVQKKDIHILHGCLVKQNRW
jgi:hypothetical protein